MRWRMLWLMVAWGVAGCQPQATPDAPWTVTDCDHTDLMVWISAFDPIVDISPEEAVQRLEAFERLPYPTCARQARSHALNTYELAYQYAEQSQRDQERVDEQVLNTLIQELDAEMENYHAALARVLPRSPTANPAEVMVQCPSLTATCPELLTCAQAQACLAAGNRDLDANGDGVACDDRCGAP
jgi:hypothetical protein